MNLRPWTWLRREPPEPPRDPRQIAIDAAVDAWHAMPISAYTASGCPPLHRYLGWTWQEYVHYTATGEPPEPRKGAV